MRPATPELLERTSASTAAPISDATQPARQSFDALLPSHLPPIRHFSELLAASTHAASNPSYEFTAPVPLEGLAVEIAARAQAGRNRFEIRLDPPELGRIEVRLDIDRSGQVTSRLVVERAETLDVLRRDAHQLERALQDAGLKTSDNGLQFSLRDQAFAGAQRRTSGRRHTHCRCRSRTARLPKPPARDMAACCARGGGIDIRI